MPRFIICIFLFLFSLPAWAGGIAVVDFQRALTEIKEGKKVEGVLNELYSKMQDEAQQLETSIKSQMAQYEKQQALLTMEARAEKEQTIMQLQMEYQQSAYNAEMVFQQEYAKQMEVLINKMRVIAEEIGAEERYDLVFESTESGLIYKDSSIPDITDLLIQRYDSKHPG